MTDGPTGLSHTRLRRIAALTAAVRETGYTGTPDYRQGTLVLNPPDAAAQAVIDGWDWTDDADPHETLRKQIAAALAANAAYLALPAPTPVQVREQVERLTRQVSAVLRRLEQPSGGV